MPASETGELEQLAEDVFASADPAGDGFDAALWATLEETGLARLTLPPSAGGGGASFLESAVVLQAAGAHAARVPLVETDLLAGWLMAGAGLPVPDGPLTLGAGDLELSRPARRAAGTLRRVPWARAAAAVVVLAGEEVVVLEPGAFTVSEGANLAEEPRDTILVDGPVTAAAIGEPVAGEPVASELRLRAALGRSQLLAGAAKGALAAAVRYAGTRVQFGRPIGKFQAIQQQLALAAAEVAAATAAASSAARVVDTDGFDATSAQLAVAAAKSRTSEAAGEVARIAHQVHGAIGFTREHDLRLLTTRLWAWRDEDGSEAEWNEFIGALGIDTVRRTGADGLWPLITGAP
jgi:acyl-CoA dehydrogenase